MDTTQTLMQRCKAELRIESDYALAKALETSTAAVSRYRTGERQMDNWTALKVANILGLEPMEVIAISELEREKNETKRKVWESFYNKHFKKLVVMLVLISGMWGFSGLETLQTTAQIAENGAVFASKVVSIVCGGVFLEVLRRIAQELNIMYIIRIILVQKIKT